MTSMMIRGSLDCPPRFGTTRSSRPTLGGQAAEISARLRRPFMPWQRYVADVALELHPDGSLVYPEVDLVVGRQEGKTELKFVIAVMRLTAMAVTHGPQRVTYTMQDRKRARTRLERDYAPRLRAAKGFREIKPSSRDRPSRRTEWRIGMNSGVEHIQFGPDSWLQIDTPSRTGGHGDTLDLGLIDEAFAHQDDTVEQGMEPAMLTRRDPQLWVLSAGGDGKAKYLWRKILRGRQLIGDGTDSGVAYFEWSAPDDADPSDPRVWQSCCPALGFTVTEAALEARYRRALAGGPAAMNLFRRAYLSQWPEIPVLEDDDRPRVISFGDWEAAQDVRSKALEPLSFAVDVASDRSSASIGVAGLRADGRVHLEVVRTDAGASWVVDKLAAVLRHAGQDTVTLCPGAPAGGLMNDLGLAGIKVNPCTMQESVQACGAFFDGIMDRRYLHIGQPVLTAAVDGAEKRRSGDAWVWDRRSSSNDVTPLVAVTLAAWALHSYTEIDPADNVW